VCHGNSTTTWHTACLQFVPKPAGGLPKHGPSSGTLVRLRHTSCSRSSRTSRASSHQDQHLGFSTVSQALTNMNLLAPRYIAESEECGAPHKTRPALPPCRMHCTLLYSHYMVYCRRHGQLVITPQATAFNIGLVDLSIKQQQHGQNCQVAGHSS
jgi:hypothetical protein